MKRLLKRRVIAAAIIAAACFTNAPGQTVLSGATTEIERAERAFAGVAVRAVRLPVPAAFHSPLVADAAKPFREALSGVDIRPGRRARQPLD